MSLTGKCEKVGEELCFTPPLYMQRYKKTAHFIEHYGNGSLCKIVDIGCSEMRLFQYLRRIQGVKEIIMMDIDSQLLQDSLHRVNPLAVDTIQKREDPLTVAVTCADAKYPHYITLNADVVTMIEFIEHLYLKDLDPVVKNVFGTIFPKLVIISTPNYDFNRFFSPGLRSGKFRHYDHKFEWTKQEFEVWCANVVRDYPKYEVTFSGCGQIPNSSEVCSQFGIFRKKESSQDSMERRNSSQEKLGTNFLVKAKPLSALLDSHRDTNNGRLDVRRPCKGCLLGHVCGVMHTVEYPIDDRTADKKFADNVRASLESLRFWLKGFLNSWDLDKGNTQFIYCFYSDPPWEEFRNGKQTEESKQASSNEGSEFSSEELAQCVSPLYCEKTPDLCASSDAVGNFEQLREIEEIFELDDDDGDDWTGFFSSDSENDSSVYSPTLQACGGVPSIIRETATTSASDSSTEALHLKFITISNLDCVFEKCENSSVKNTFFYNDDESEFLIPLSTFCAWSRLSPEGRVREVVSAEAESPPKAINSTYFIVLSLLEEEESGESDDQWEGTPTDLSRRRVHG